MKRFLAILSMILMAVMIFIPSLAHAAEKKKFKVAYSHYTGWEFMRYAIDSGIMKKWADKYGIEVQIDLINDYGLSLTQFSSGDYDAVTVTNMDALAVPAIGGIDSEVVIMGDYSNGNDGIVVINGASCKDLKGRKVIIYSLTVSHYLLARCLSEAGVKEKDLTLLDTKDAIIVSVFGSDTNPDKVVVAWNPMLMEIRNVKNAKMIYDSSKIPGEILDMVIVKTSAPESLKKALAGAWYDMMKIISTPGKERDEAVKLMAANADCTVAMFEAQLKTTRLYTDPKEGASFTASKQLKDTMEYVRTFTFDHGLFGQDAVSKDVVGIQFPDGSVMGNKKNVKLRFTDKYMKLAAESKLSN